MAQILTLKNGENTTVFTVKDFLYLVEQHMGYEAADYLRNLQAEINSSMDDVLTTIDELFVSPDTIDPITDRVCIVELMEEVRNVLQ